MQTANDIVSWIVRRLKEPSTWAGICSILVALGFTLSGELQESLASAGVAIAGLLAIILKDKAQ